MSGQWQRSSRWVSQIPTFARRAFQADQMEFDSALSQMYSLCTHPSLVSKMSKARKMTKNYYYRDDPAFLVLQLAFIVVCTIAYGSAIVQTNISGLLFWTIPYNLLSYGFWALVFSAATRAFVERFLEGSLSINEVRRSVDWRYALDVHCNGYFTFFMWSKVLPFMLLPLIAVSINSFLVILLFNMLFSVGCCTYFYNVFLGYLELPSLTRQQMIMYPVPVIFVFMVISSFVANTNYVLAFVPA